MGAKAALLKVALVFAAFQLLYEIVATGTIAAGAAHFGSWGADWPVLAFGVLLTVVWGLIVYAIAKTLSKERQEKQKPTQPV